MQKVSGSHDGGFLCRRGFICCAILSGIKIKALGIGEINGELGLRCFECSNVILYEIYSIVSYETLVEEINENISLELFVDLSI